jgi:hypothetical protein
MILTLIKRALKAVLHDATEEWALECGVPRAAVERERAQRLERTAQAEARADAEAAKALGIADDDASLALQDEPHAARALPMPASSRVTDQAGCPAPDAGEDALMAWVHCQREHCLPWADVVRLVKKAGHVLGESRLRKRYRLWSDQHDQGVGGKMSRE